MVGDLLYGTQASRARSEALGWSRQALHSFSLAFPNPSVGRVSVEAPFPDDLKRLLELVFPDGTGA